jgi:selenocysteine-specific elongation factor
MRVVGTAGHVDHGKSTLIEALTGTHPDRLKEEQEREMTIDLGFAWMNLPGGEEIGIIDVPGHRDFIENMLAGIGGIDVALFVVAADEGVMPQTREHLAILDILQIPGGLVVLTKVDLVEDGLAETSDWLDLVEEDIRLTLLGTVLESAPIIRVSARKRVGLERVWQALSDCLAERPSRPDLGRPRLPVDRIFTMPGFGTVVTGTLSDGQLRIGEEVQILPSGMRGRVRGLQTHGRKQEVAYPGSRTAVNISGVDVDEIRRGEVVTRPGLYKPTQRLDAWFRLLGDASQPLRHNTEVKFFSGSAEIVGRVRLLGVETIEPGEEGWLQIELREPVVVMRSDHYILRRPSPGETLGGGTVIDPHPKGRHKRFIGGTIERLEALAGGTPGDVLKQAALALGAAPIKEVVSRSNLDAAQARPALVELIDAKQLIVLEDGRGEVHIESDQLVISSEMWELLSRRALEEVSNTLRANPLRRGMAREELKSRLNIPPRLFNAMVRRLVAEEQLEEAGPLVYTPGHEIRFNPQQERKIVGLLDRFSKAPYAPPTVKEAQNEVGDEVYGALVELGRLIPVSNEVAFRKEDYEKMVEDVCRLLEKRGTLTAAEARDHFDTSRRYVLALLEHLDATGITVREGDVRRLK